VRCLHLDHLPAQDEFYNETCDVCAFVAGLGLGKTFAASDKILTGFAHYPLARHFIFSNTYDQLMAGTLTTFFERLQDVWMPAHPGFRIDIRKARNRARAFKEIDFPMFGGKIEVRSVDQDINWKSLEICRAWIDEAQAWDKAPYDMVIGRLRGTKLQRRIYPDMQLQVFITANPPHTHNHWLYELCKQDDPKLGRPRIKLFTGSTYDNPFLPADYIERIEDMYDPELAKAELHGEFINIGRGRVFRMFLTAKHAMSSAKAVSLGLPALDYDPTLPLCWSHDFNLDPLCSILFQWRTINVKGYQKTVMYVLDSIRIEDGLISAAAKELLNRPSACDIARRNGIILYGDASGANQSNRQTNKSDFIALKEELTRLGFRGVMRVKTANPTHRERAQAANRLLENSRGEVGVIVRIEGGRTETNRYLVLDVEKMVWKPGTWDIEIEKPKPGEMLPKNKRMTHLGDAFSYPIDYEYPYTEDQNGSVSTVR
jgi:Phage terminase large subunit